MRTFWEKPQNISTESVDMVDAVKSSLSMVKRQVYDHSIELVHELPNARILVFANYIQFEQIVVNLIVNSIHSLDKVKKDHKLIRIKVRHDEQNGILEIHDNGTGIEEGIQEKIYDPLFTTKDAGVGSGLGMAIVKSFIDKFQGEISNYNNDEGGASFILRFKLQE